MIEARAFEPDFLSRLDGLAMGIRRARTARVGQRTIGRVLGAGLELENYKSYVEGDELRFLDWNAFARLDSLLIKTYRPERQVEISALVDASASMGVPRGDDKLGLALALAAAIAYLGMSSNDAARIAAFSAHRGAIRLAASALRRRRETYLDFRDFVIGVRAEGEAAMSGAIDEFLRGHRRPGVVVLLSDFLVAAADYESALTRLLAAHHQVKVIQVLGACESTGAWPPGRYRVRDAENGALREMTLGPQTAEACRARAARLCDRVRDFCAAREIFYAPAFGADNLERIIEREFPRLELIC